MIHFWDEAQKEWYFSVVDIVGVLTDSVDERKYWNKLKKRLNEEGSELVTFCHQLKMQSADDKFYKTDALDTKGILRLVQSIPSPKAEPFKMWLAEVGSERLDEIADPEKSFDRGVETYLKKGYSREWINQRLLTIEMRKQLTDEMTKAWSRHSVKGYKAIKGLKKENLRDNMTNLKLVLNMLAEVTTTAISREEKPTGFDESLKVARDGGNVAKNARLDIERRIRCSVLSPATARTKALDETMESVSKISRGFSLHFHVALGTVVLHDAVHVVGVIAACENVINRRANDTFFRLHNIGRSAVFGSAVYHFHFVLPYSSSVFLLTVTIG